MPMTTETTLDERLDRIDAQLERIAMAVVKSSDRTDKKIDSVEMNLKAQIDIYARAVDATRSKPKPTCKKC